VRRRSGGGRGIIPRVRGAVNSAAFARGAGWVHSGPIPGSERFSPPRTALSPARAFTDPGADDPRLRGRRYAVPFARVWEAALAEVRSRRRWTLLEVEARAGEIHAEARTPLWRFTDDVWIRLSLDADGQTRVDMVSASRVGSADLGANARRIARFLHALDRRLTRERPESQPRSR
jgi:Protein of unknown function (DUF1499)